MSKIKILFLLLILMFIMFSTGCNIISQYSGESITENFNKPISQENVGTEYANYTSANTVKIDGSKEEYSQTEMKATEVYSSENINSNTTERINEVSTTKESTQMNTTKKEIIETKSTSFAETKTMTSTVNLSEKNKEIEEENNRHNIEVKEINDYWQSVTNNHTEEINSIKQQYGISYVYEDVICVEKIKKINSDLSTVNEQIFRIEPYKNEKEYASKYRGLQSQKNQLENEKTIYEKMREINRINTIIESGKEQWKGQIEEENTTHEKNINAINAKYS